MGYRLVSYLWRVGSRSDTISYNPFPLVLKLGGDIVSNQSVNIGWGTGGADIRDLLAGSWSNPVIMHNGYKVMVTTCDIADLILFQYALHDSKPNSIQVTHNGMPISTTGGAAHHGISIPLSVVGGVLTNPVVPIPDVVLSARLAGIAKH